MHRGYIKLWRKLQDEDEFWKKRRQFSQFEAWIDILMQANHSEKMVLIGNKAIKCNRGESINSLATWAKRWNWQSIKKVRCFLLLCQDLEKLVYKNETVTTRISICNYSKYQDIGNAEETHRKSKGNGQETQRKTNKNDKNVKNVKNGIYTVDFLDVWNCYPRKSGKGSAYKAWSKLKYKPLSEIKNALKWQKDLNQWAKDNGEYIPYLSTYLNNRGWEDEKPEIEDRFAFLREEENG